MPTEAEIESRIRLCVANRYALRGAPRAPNLASMADFINTKSKRFQARTRAGYCNTDRKIPGTRLRSPGQGRQGTLLEVTDVSTGEVVLHHNAAETYRYNGEVALWIFHNLLETTETDETIS